MPWNLLIFPLIAGYYFITKCWFLRFYHLRIERQRLIFNSTIAGIFFLFISFIITIILSRFTKADNAFEAVFPKIEYLGTSILSFILAVVAAHILNLFTNKNDRNFKAIAKIGNDLERIVAESNQTMGLIQLTLSSGKVYVGLPTTIAAPGDLHYLTIFPLYSGYRNNETKKVIFTTHYTEAFESFADDDPDNDIKLEVTIKCDQIITATPFDIDLYKKFNTKVAP